MQFWVNAAREVDAGAYLSLNTRLDAMVIAILVILRDDRSSMELFVIALFTRGGKQTLLEGPVANQEDDYSSESKPMILT